MLQSLWQSDKALASLLIKAKKDVYSRIVGEHATHHKGSGYDFIELRPYESGDDIRHIDWIISSKLATPHVKLFHQAKELNITIISLLSGSMHFGTKRLKQSMATEVAALISFSAVAQNDPFESYIYNTTLIPITPKSKKMYSVRKLVEQISSYDALNHRIDYKNLSHFLYKQIPKRSLLFLSGDFLDADEIDLSVLSLKHQLFICIIRDRFEEDPKDIGTLHITDPQNQTSAFINFAALAKKHQKKRYTQDQKLFAELNRLDIAYTKIYTDEDPAKKILQLMERR